ncbi:MAG: FKBP-type peptidyl-prolyl cis-trans isomerase [Salinivirgaceae bacterium]|nr:FKBP-type peptidyl-prolyl cis-trans isomerase [Salinivirgaceae bacterium]
MKRLFYLGILTALVALYSCNNDRKVHEKGFEYIIHKQDNYGLVPRVGDIMILDLKITAPNDSVLESANSIPMQLQKPSHEGGSIEDALIFMHRGDSMTFFINAINFYSYSKKEPAPMHFSENEILRFDIVMRDIMSMKKFEEVRRTNRSSGFLEERVFVDQYLNKVSKNRTEIDSMLYYIPELVGTGAKIKEGDIVAFHYLSYFLDGKMFSNTYKNNTPFIITVGDNSIIEGLTKGIIGLQEGSKGRIVIPSYLAYGTEGIKDMVPPFSTLVFDVEIISVKQKK